MTDAAARHRAVLACLREIAAGDEAALSVYDGDVDDEPPVDNTEGGIVLPYAVLWGSADADPTEQPVTGPDVDTGSAWRPMITVAGGTQTYALQGAELVRRAMRVLQLPGGGRLRQPVGYVPPQLQLDRDVDPPRYHVLLEWDALLP